ncbi:MAG: Imm50 family immunity protein [Janthinobacterium lividum]
MNTSENSAVSQIINSELVIQHFGYWPKFHDTTLAKMSIEVKASQSVIKFLIETAEFTNELNERGQYKDFKPCFIELEFHNVKSTALDFDHVPVLFDVVFEKDTNGLVCYFDSSAGSYSIAAEKIAVVSIIPTAQ